VTLPARVQAALQRTHARPAIAQGIRAGVVTVCPLIVGVLTGHGLDYTWVSLGAFQASLADNGGPYRVRAVSMSAVVLGGTLAVIVGSIASRWALAAVPLAFLAAFVSGMVRVYGSAGAVVGVNNLVITLVALAYPIRGIGIVTRRAEFFFIGAALSAVAALLLWPFQPNNPARQAVADCFDRLADLVRVLASMAGASDHGSDAWHERPRQAHAAVRAALEVARAEIATVRLARDGEMRRSEQLLALMVVAERVFGLTYPLADLMETTGLAAPGPEAERLRAALTDVAARLTRVAALVRPNSRAVPTALTTHVNVPALPNMRGILEELSIAEPVAEALQRGAPMPNLAQNVLEAARALRPPTRDGVRAVLEPMVVLLRENWGFRSISFQHAVRLAVGVGAAEAVAVGTGLPRGYWLTVTTGIILQPYAGATVERAIQRVAGTVAGVLVAALITAVLHGPLPLTLVLFPLTVLTFAVRPISYWYFVLFLTPIFVLLAEGLRSDPHLAVYRLLNTVLGGMLATICGALVFPAWEREGLADDLATAVDAVREYLRSVIGESSTPAPVARRAMGLANGNAEVAVQRLAGEGRQGREAFVAGTTVAAVLRRLGGVLSALAAVREETPDAVREAEASVLAQRLEAALAAVSTALRARRVPEALPPWPPVDERRFPLAPLLTRQVEVLHGAVAAFEAVQPA
jgi:uncharacterized membrane protein YccC